MTSVDLVNSYLDSFSTADPERVASHVSDDFINIQVNELGEDCQGRDAYRERLTNFLGTFMQIRYTIEQLIEQGDKVAVAYRLKAREENIPIDIQGVMIITVADGKIVERRDYWDGLSYQRQVN